MAPIPVDRVPIPIERELQERLAWFIRLRWLAAAGIVSGSAVASCIAHLNLQLVPVFLLGLGILGYNVLFHRYVSRADQKAQPLGRNVIYLQIGLDWLALFLVVRFTGGIRSPLALAFVFHIIIGAILLSRRACYFLAGGAALLTGAVAALDGLGVRQSALPDLLASFPIGGSSSPMGVWIVNSIVFGIVAYLATSITRRLREKEEVLFHSERALDRAYRETEALYKIGKVISSTLDMNEVLSLIAQNATQLMGMKGCSIRIYDQSGDRLSSGGSYGLSPSFVDKGPVELSASLLDRQTLDQGVIQVPEVGDDRRFRYREEAAREGIHSALCAPISAKNRALGVIRVYSAVPYHFSQQEETLLANLATLGALAIENAHTYAELKAMNEQRTWFARMTHHQLRAPLSAIQSVLEAIPYAGPLLEKQEELLRRAARRVQDVLTLIRDLLDLAAAQNSPASAPEVAVEIHQTLRNVIEETRERARAKGLEFSFVTVSDDLFVRTQAEDLERLISNLLDNAVKYTPRGGFVRFEIAAEGGVVRISVSDSGIGIEPRDLKRIFDGFYRAQAAKDSGEMGTGLGLSIVQRLVDRYGAKLDVDSVPGKGTRFTLTLPHCSGPDTLPPDPPPQ
jgi:signal transduction histidine kinase